MKVFLLFLLFQMDSLSATTLAGCPQGTIRTIGPSGSMACVTSILPPTIENGFCATPHVQPLPQSFYQTFPPQFFPAGPVPWWAQQGQLYYPNVYYPGPWRYPYIQAPYYPGNGPVFAAKPNVYVDTIYEKKKFQLKFLAQNPSFLATTPLLEKDNLWKGVIKKDTFEVDDINYDYLFYDVRLGKEKLQWEAGLCTDRESIISWMLKDLKDLGHSALSRQDFEEHWRVKIPDYPIYCLYPQYNRELDEAFPVEFNLPYTQFIRSLYVLVPHEKSIEASNPGSIPFPIKDHHEARPKSQIRTENMFREWGVAFLGNQ